MSLLEPAAFFFLPPSSSPASSSSSSGSRTFFLGGAFMAALPLADLPFDVVSASSSAPPLPAFLGLPALTACLSRSAGSSTTKRYLHLGQSIFFPIMPASLTGTRASQLGHCCLKAELMAITSLQDGTLHKNRKAGEARRKKSYSS